MFLVLKHLLHKAGILGSSRCFFPLCFISEALRTSLKATQQEAAKRIHETVLKAENGASSGIPK